MQRRNFVHKLLAGLAGTFAVVPDAVVLALVDPRTTSDVVRNKCRYESAKVIYVEGQREGQWLGLYWSANGHINFPQGDYDSPHWRNADNAFALRAKDDPSLRTSRGVCLSKGWMWQSTREAPRTKRGARHVVVELSHAAQLLRLKIHTLLDGTPVLTRWLEITNESERPIALTEVSPWSGRLWPRSDPFTLGYQRTNKGDREGISGGRLEWKHLVWGATSVASDEGNGYDDPFFIVRDDANGEYFIGHLAWTANYGMDFKCSRDHSSSRIGLSFELGPLAVNALRVLDAGEAVKSPSVHLGHTAGSLEGAVHAMHEHFRRSVQLCRPRNRSYLIQYAVPRDQGYYPGDAFNESNILKSIDVAAAVGSEVFIIDQGWWDIYGEWVPSKERFPRGLKPLAEYIHEKGMLFGLYLEVEGGRGNWNESRIFKQHPDWFSDQNILRLDRPEVAGYLESELIRVIREYHLDLYRHDFIPIPLFTHEGPSATHGGFVENCYWRYYENYYGVWERIHRKFPNLVLQMCSNGGAREDLAMLSHFHETYTNEGDIGDILPAYSGKTLSLPPEILVFGVHSGGPLDTYLRVMFTLSTPWILNGAAPSIGDLTPERRGKFLHYANLYKEFIRPVLPNAKVFHHAPVSEQSGYCARPWFAMEFASPDRAKGWATVVRLTEGSDSSYCLRPRGLDAGKTYRVSLDSSNTSMRLPGLSLIEGGLTVRLDSVLSSELVLFEEQAI